MMFANIKREDTFVRIHSRSLKEDTAMSHKPKAVPLVAASIHDIKY